MTTRDIPVFLSIDAAPEALGFDSGAMKGIRELLIRYVEGGHIAGAAALVARYGQIVQRLAVGWADLDTKKPLASDTLFRIFSLTKPITSVAALMLVEQGAVALDDPVSDYIPAFRDVRVFAGLQGGRIVTEPPRRSLTVRHLLTHTSGVAGTAMRSDEPLAAAYRNARIGDERLTLAEMCERLAEIPLLFHPGEQWRYGVSTDVLARVVEVASGMSFGRFLRERLFLPLGMHDTSYVVPPEKRDRLATLYTATAGGLRPLKHTNVTPANAAAAGTAPADARAASNAQVARGELATAYRGAESEARSLGPTLESGSTGLVSTITDYFRFAQMLLDEGRWQNQSLLRAETVRMMVRNQLPPDLLPYRLPWPHVARYTAGCGYGFGVRVVMDLDRWGLPGSVGEYGWAGASNTYLWIDPVKKIVALLFAQVFPFMHTDLDRQFKRLVYAALMD